MKKLTCFKAYDIRGKLGEELNEDIAWRIGRAYGEFLKPKTIVLGGDVRLTSETLKLALAKGLQDAGVDVLDIGMSGTEEIYFATFHLGVDGGIEVTASHNPMDYNGMKLVREGARPISGDTGLRDVQRLAEANDFPPVDETKRGRYQQINLRDAYVDHLFGYINVKNLTPLKLVINSGNGAAGPVVDAIEARFKALGAPVELIKVHNTPDGNFPNGIPNPLLPECRDDTRNAVIKHGADMGIAFDGDADRLALLSTNYSYKGDELAILFAREMASRGIKPVVIGEVKCSSIMYDEIDKIGKAVMYKTGHSNLKVKLKELGAHLAAEMSGHIFFKERYFGYDDAIYSAFRALELFIKATPQEIESQIAALPKMFSTPEEKIATTEERKFALIAELKERLANPPSDFPKIVKVIDIDGLRVVFENGWGLLRASNTTPVLVSRFEARSQESAMLYKQKMLDLLAQCQ